MTRFDSTSSATMGPAGGLQLRGKAQRRWRWARGRGLWSAPVRCKREQWYLVRGAAAETALEPLRAVFSRDGAWLAERIVALRRSAGGNGTAPLLGWLRAPKDATHVQLHFAQAAEAARFQSITLHPVAERDPCCHPLANVPRWSAYPPPAALRRIVVPQALETLVQLLPHHPIHAVSQPRSRGQLLKLARGAACVLDQQWVIGLNLELADVERLAAESWLFLDLETLAALVMRATGLPLRLDTPKSPHGIMSARVEYADVATRGFALLDAVPYSTLDSQGRFCLRMLRAGRAWKRYAAETGFATVLSSETPWAHDSRHVLSAARPVGRGELIGTDLPWLAAGLQGPLLAPRIVRHLLDTHWGGPVDDAVQYWNRSDEIDILVRDVQDLARRYAPLRAARWRSTTRDLAHLGVTLPALGDALARRHLLIQTGRIDDEAVHDGLPAEPLMIFMKWLARERRENTAWARRFLDGMTITWQFDTAVGLHHAVSYESAGDVEELGPTEAVRVRLGTSGQARTAPAESLNPKNHNPINRPAAAPTFVDIWADEGIQGDGAFAFQAELTDKLRRRIEHGFAR